MIGGSYFNAGASLLAGDVFFKKPERLVKESNSICQAPGSVSGPVKVETDHTSLLLEPSTTIFVILKVPCGNARSCVLTQLHVHIQMAICSNFFVEQHLCMN